MKRLFGILLIFAFLWVDTQAQSNVFIPKSFTIISKKKGKQLLKQCSRQTPKKIKAYFDLSNDLLQKLDSNFLKIGASDFLDKYGYQYVGLIIKNKRYIYINAFRIELIDSHKDWKTVPIDICDGGDGFWGVLFELESETFSQYYTNGF